MAKAKWIMKQYWRIGTVRAIFALLMGMLILARYYYVFIPWLLDMGFFGALFLALILLLIFLFAGYLYDVKGRLWSEKMQVMAEKNVYSYVPSFKSLSTEYPYVYCLVDTMKQILTHYKLNTTAVDDLAVYLDSYFSRSAQETKDIKESQRMANEFNAGHRFTETQEPKRKCVGIRARIAKGFQLQVWRLTWVQNFSGLAQDVLVFAALYVGILFAEVAEANVVPFNYLILGILTLSLPLYLGLVVAGWYYDKKLRLWSPDMAVKVERNPYSYVPDLHMIGYEQPFLYALFNLYLSLFNKLNLDNSELVKATVFLESFWTLTAGIHSDMDVARNLRKDFGKVFVPIEDGVHITEVG